MKSVPRIVNKGELDGVETDTLDIFWDDQFWINFGSISMLTFVAEIWCFGVELSFSSERRINHFRSEKGRFDSISVLLSAELK